MKLTEKIHLLKIDFDIVTESGERIPRFVNVIIVLGEKITLIDTGVKGSEEKISEYLKEYNRNLSETDIVILSHSHPDHIGSASVIREQTGCRVLAHKNESNWISNIDLQNRERPVPGFFNLVDQPVTPDGFLNDGDIISADKDVTLEIIHAPGHSPGSLNILFREDRILFTADSVPVKNDIPNYDNAGDLLLSLGKIKTGGGYDLLLTSWTLPLASREEITRKLEEGEEYIMKIDGIVKGIYRGEEVAPLTFCTKVIRELGLPSFLAMSVVDKAFRSHISAR